MPYYKFYPWQTNQSNSERASKSERESERERERERERKREREGEKQRTQVWAIMFLNCQGPNEKSVNYTVHQRAVQYVINNPQGQLTTYYPCFAITSLGPRNITHAGDVFHAWFIFNLHTKISLYLQFTHCDIYRMYSSFPQHQPFASTTNQPSESQLLCWW